VVKKMRDPCSAVRALERIGDGKSANRILKQERPEKAIGFFARMYFILDANMLENNYFPSNPFTFSKNGQGTIPQFGTDPA
jgi:hypothetical protein